mmetsp:Transcript_23241/g.39380  ORF Transcript_23241/g.39380 Transcript_23241/m.39380 type:complete len:193 (+) Transcript_23241:397-975(+)
MYAFDEESFTNSTVISVTGIAGAIIDFLHAAFFYYYKVCVNQKGTCYGDGDDKECSLARACAHPNYDCSCVMDTDYFCSNYNIKSQYECGAVVNDLPVLLFFSALGAISLFVIMLGHCTAFGGLSCRRSKNPRVIQHEPVSGQHLTDLPQECAPSAGTVMMAESVAPQVSLSNNDKSTEDDEKMLVDHTIVP